jgi:hypothetical protein
MPVDTKPISDEPPRKDELVAGMPDHLTNSRGRRMRYGPPAFPRDAHEGLLGAVWKFRCRKVQSRIQFQPIRGYMSRSRSVTTY